MIQKVILKIRNNDLLYRYLKPFADFLQSSGIYDIPIIILRYKEFRVKPLLRKLKGRKDTQRIKEFEGIHQGKRIFLISSGPSLREKDIVKLKNEITIGVNGTISLYDKIGWKPTYYCVGDPAIVEKYKDKIINANLKNVFFSLQLKKYEKQMNFVPIYYEEYLQGYYRTVFNKKTKKYMHVSTDLFKKGVYIGGRSVATEAFQLALYMGATEIYLYGQDCDYSGKAHFDEQDTNNHMEVKNSFIESMFAFYEVALKLCKKNHLKVFNATRGGKLEIFDRINLDEISSIKC